MPKNVHQKNSLLSNSCPSSHSIDSNLHQSNTNSNDNNSITLDGPKSLNDFLNLNFSYFPSSNGNEDKNFFQKINDDNSNSTRNQFLIKKFNNQFIIDNNHDKIFKIVGPNIYWLGLDENVIPSPSYPSQTRILEALATAALMGSTVVRSTTLGVSVGNQFSVWPSLNSTNQDALKTIGFSVSVAQKYGLKLIIPLTDQYDYYHGGFRTFLRWRNLTESDSNFYDTNSIAHKDFLNYISVLLNYVNPYTDLALKDDPTILIWETGNELSNPTRKWTESVSKFIHELAPNQFVSSGRYGLNKIDLRIPTIDAVTNHFYPPRSDHFQSDAKLAAKFNKVYYVGEYDWSGRSKAWGQLGYVLIPVAISVVLLFLGKRFFPIRINWNSNPARPSNDKFITTRNNSQFQPKSSSSSRIQLISNDNNNNRSNINNSTRNNYSNYNNSKSSSILIQQYHLSLFFLVIVVPLTVFIIYFSSIQFTGLETFLNKSEANQDSSGDIFWSLFGHDDQCCDWVEHSDGFTLHYPGRTNDEKGSVSRIIEHNYKMRSIMISSSINSTTQPSSSSSNNSVHNNFDLINNHPSIKTNKVNFKFQNRDDWYSFGDKINLNCTQSLNL